MVNGLPVWDFIFPTPDPDSDKEFQFALLALQHSPVVLPVPMHGVQGLWTHPDGEELAEEMVGYRLPAHPEVAATLAQRAAALLGQSIFYYQSGSAGCLVKPETEPA